MILGIWKLIKKYPWIGGCIILLVILGFKQCTIESLEKQLDSKQIEIVYDNTPDVVEIPIPTDPEIIIPATELVKDGTIVTTPVNHGDTVKLFPIFQSAYVDWITQKTYTGVAKDDSSMLINYNIQIQYNKLQKFTLPQVLNRYPYTITNTVEKTPIRVLGGFNISPEYFNLGLGYQSRKGNIYELTYDPTNKVYGIGFKTTLFKF